MPIVASLDLEPGEGIGADLLALVRRARAQGVDPEAALREQVRLLEAAARANAT